MDGVLDKGGAGLAGYVCVCVCMVQDARHGPRSGVWKPVESTGKFLGTVLYLLYTHFTALHCTALHCTIGNGAAEICSRVWKWKSTPPLCPGLLRSAAIHPPVHHHLPPTIHSEYRPALLALAICTN
jgi:hypothetical protein